jgi:hypothetical protein
MTGKFHPRCHGFRFSLFAVLRWIPIFSEGFSVFPNGDDCLRSRICGDCPGANDVADIRATSQIEVLLSYSHWIGSDQVLTNKRTIAGLNLIWQLRPDASSKESQRKGREKSPLRLHRKLETLSFALTRPKEFF